MRENLTDEGIVQETVFNFGRTIGRPQKSSVQMFLCYYAMMLIPVGLELA